MSNITGFAPIADKRARVLVLGSMPSEASLASAQYYAHPRNSFWFIMENLFATETGLSYDQRTQLLRQNHVALWDVMHSCRRSGSLDTAIERDSILANAFVPFFKAHNAIEAVFFNGARAEQEYKKRVLPELEKNNIELRYQRLPSTSPAMASLDREKKLLQWQPVREAIKKAGHQPGL